ncbi:MAG: GntR family transcriptional regulator [Sedimentisphaerales bacterium]|nr:GntR family transcriptional regulator [Sedimentisphaerales bacterium]
MKKKTKSQIAHEKLRKMILAGQFSGKYAWSLRSLAEKFKMSVVPITEAVRRLEQDGLLVVHPQRGISIQHLTVSQLRQANVVREGIEIQAARIVARKRCKETIDELMKIAERLKALIEQNKTAQISITDYKLHKKLVDASDNDILVETYEKLLTLSMITTEAAGISSFGQRDKPQEFQDHIALIKAIGSGDPEKAEKAVRDHIASDAD